MAERNCAARACVGKWPSSGRCRNLLRCVRTRAREDGGDGAGAGLAFERGRTREEKIVFRVPRSKSRARSG